MRVLVVMNRKEVDSYIKQTIWGIIPRELWQSHKDEKKDPFKNLSDEEARVIKRRFRKLKRKSKVTKYNTCETMWRKINSFLDDGVK